METASTYFTRRAGQERANAADAGSAEARKAHLELAFRLVKVATQPALWAWPSNADAHKAAALAGDIRDVLAGAFPVLSSATFGPLLEALDRTDLTRRH